MEICYIAMKKTCILLLLNKNNVSIIHLKVILHLVMMMHKEQGPLQKINLKIKEIDNLRKNLFSHQPLGNLIKILIFLVQKLDLKQFKSQQPLKKKLNKDNQILLLAQMYQVMMRQQILTHQIILLRHLARDKKKIGEVKFFLGQNLILVIEKFQLKKRQIVVIITVMIMILLIGNLSSLQPVL